MAAPKWEIPGLQLSEEVGKGAHSVLYRADKDGRQYVVKLVKPELDQAQQDRAYKAFLKEGTTLARLTHPSLVKIYEIGKWGNRWYLVLEFIEGETLGTKIQKGDVPEEILVGWLKSLAGALWEVHRHGMVHRDLKPSNVIIDKNGNAKLIDFGLVASDSVMLEEEEVVGTLLYAPPEQTGMIRRLVDGRADLYSLGAIAFECISGRPPFIADNVSELIRKHAVEPVPDLSLLKPSLSRGLNQIILKLLSKDPDDRYPDAKSLLSDLESLQEINASLKKKQTVLLPFGTSSFKETLSTEFVGRDDELSSLKTVWRAIPVSQSAIVRISGQTGVGKSRLVTQFISSAREPTTLILRGKCSESNVLPFGVFNSALQDLAVRLTNSSISERDKELNRIEESATGYIPQLQRFTPELFSSLKAVSTNSEGLDQEAVFTSAVTEFFDSFLRRHRSTIIILEDAQWVDDASLGLVKRFLRGLENSSILFILTIREVSSEPASSPDRRLIKGVELHIEPFAEMETGKLIRSLLGEHGIEPELVKQVQAGSRGNPGAIVEYVRILLEEGILRYHWGNWLFDDTSFKSLALPNDMIDLTLRRIDHISIESKRVLQVGAVFTSTIRSSVLAKILGLEPSETEAALREALDVGILHLYARGQYRFVHDQVRDSLARNIPANVLSDLHQSLAEAMDLDEDQSDEQIYVKAHHFANGHINNDPRRSFEKIWDAGKIASRNYANQMSFDFLRKAEEILSFLPPEPRPDLFRLLAEVCFRLDRVEHGIEYSRLALSQASDSVQRAEIRIRLATGYLSRLHVREARLEILKGLREVGHPFPRTRIFQILSTLAIWLAGSLIRYLPFIYGKAKGRRRKVHQTIAKLYETGYLISIHEFDNLLSAQFILRGLYSSHLLGPSSELSSLYSSMATLFAISKLGRLSRAYSRRGQFIAEAINDKQSIAESKLYDAFCEDLIGDTELGLSALESALEHYGPWLQHNRYLDACFPLVLAYRTLGRPNDVFKWLDRALQRTEQAISPVGTGFLMYPAYKSVALAALGRVSEAQDEMRLAEELSEKLSDDRFSWAFYLTQRISLQFELNAPAKDIFETEEKFIDKVKLNPSFAIIYAKYFYLFQAYAHLHSALRLSITDTNAKRHVKALQKAIRVLSSVRKWPLFRPHFEFLQSGFNVLHGRQRSARKWLNLCEETLLSSTLSNSWVEIEILLLKAFLNRRIGKTESAQFLAKTAAEIAIKSHWANRVVQIDQTFEIGATYQYSNQRSGELETPTVSHTTMRLKRQLETLLQLSAASASTVEPWEIARITLDEVLRVFGAERAFLFLYDEDKEKLIPFRGRDFKSEDLPLERGWSESIVSRALNRKETVIIAGTENSRITSSESIRESNLRSIIAAPVLFKNEKKGALYLDSRLAKGLFTQDDVELIEAIANQVGNSLETLRTAQLEMERAYLKKAFQQYVSVEVVDNLLSDPRKLALTTERKTLTIMFTDIRSFTSFSENMAPDVLTELMNEYFTEMTLIINQNGGVVDKYIGDAIMAFWGAPIEIADHSKRAARAALAMQERLVFLREKWLDRKLPKIEIGIGINTGAVSIGNIGSSQRFNYTVLGDAVNVASRLEEQTKDWGVQILASDTVISALDKNEFLFRELDQISIRGKTKTIGIHELMAANIEQDESRAEYFKYGLTCFRNGNVTEASRFFEKVLSLNPNDKPSLIYLSRIRDTGNVGRYRGLLKSIK